MNLPKVVTSSLFLSLHLFLVPVLPNVEVARFKLASLRHTPICFSSEKHFKYVLKINDSLFHHSRNKFLKCKSHYLDNSIIFPSIGVVYKTACKFNQKYLYLISSRGQCYKNTVVNYRGNFKPTFSRVKMMQYITTIPGLIVLL
jgi:hypothetical protein